VFSPPFIQLDYLYTPSADVVADMKYFVDVLGAEVAFAVEGMGARVAMLRLTEAPPHVLLTDHLEGDSTIFIYRVAAFDSALRDLKARGWKKAHSLEIPMAHAARSLPQVANGSLFTSSAGHRSSTISSAGAISEVGALV